MSTSSFEVPGVFGHMHKKAASAQNGGLFVEQQSGSEIQLRRGVQVRPAADAEHPATVGVGDRLKVPGRFQHSGRVGQPVRLADSDNPPPDMRGYLTSCVMILPLNSTASIIGNICVQSKAPRDEVPPNRLACPRKFPLGQRI